MNIFYITFQHDYFNKGDLIVTSNIKELIVLEKPHRKWYKVLLQWITFGWYRAPYQYKVKVI